MTIVKATPSANGTARPRGRDIADAAIRLRVYVATELRRQCEEAGLDSDQCCSSAVTSTLISLEKQGLRGIPVQTDVVS
jgi:hypothetical protein